MLQKIGAKSHAKVDTLRKLPNDSGLPRIANSHPTLDALRQLPNDLSLPRIGIVGGVGCGATTIIQLAIVPSSRNIILASGSDNAIEQSNEDLTRAPRLCIQLLA